MQNFPVHLSTYGLGDDEALRLQAAVHASLDALEERGASPHFCQCSIAENLLALLHPALHLLCTDALAPSPPKQSLRDLGLRRARRLTATSACSRFLTMSTSTAT